MPDERPEPHRVVIPVFDGVELLDVTGPAEVFSAASRLLRGRGYAVELVAARPGPVLTSSGVQLVATGDLPADAAGTVVVPGALAHDGTGPVVDPVVVQWIRNHHRAWDRVASVCAGAHMLAAAGLLDGRRATTHWYSAERLAHDHPAVLVDPDAIFIKAGRVWTCAGVTSGMDLALAMVAEDHDERLARSVARWLVMYLRRPGGQSQFSVPLSTLEPESPAIRELQHWIREHPGEDLSVPALAPPCQPQPAPPGAPVRAADRGDAGRLRRGQPCRGGPAAARADAASA